MHRKTPPTDELHDANTSGQRTIVHLGPAPAPSPEQRPTTSPARPDREPGSASDTFENGTTISGTRYRVIQCIGDGGMGTVYEAEHVDIERRCALKVLKPEFTRSPGIVEQFRREARAASRVGAEQIVQVFDFAELSDGRVMFTMDLVRGETLRHELREGALPSNRAIGILRQICKGLHAAHNAGVVHRDVKPENIVLERRMGRVDAVKLLDFGIAAMVDEDGGPLSAGTPHYLAPELVTGSSFDRRADIYGVGCTAYEMLTGRTPFGNRGESIEEVLESHLCAVALPPSKVRPDLRLSPALDRVVMRCLEKKPEQRYSNMGELEAALCAAQIDATLQTSWDDLPLPAEVDDDLRDRLLREMPDMHGNAPRRRRWLVPLIAAMSLALGIGATYLALSRLHAGTVAAPSAVDNLVADARAAAARSSFVYPPADDPGAPSAFAKIRELEQLGSDDARAAALALRREFSATLVQLGDSYWARPGGQPFAVEYYKQALVFDRDNARALERGATATDQVDALVQRAEVGKFSAQELARAESLRELAAPDRGRRSEKLTGPRPAPAPPASDGAPAGAREGADPGEAGPKPTPVVAASERSGAEELAATGTQLLAQGKRADAEEVFRLALTYDPSNARALRGLYRLELERGNLKAAARHAEALLASAPDDGSNHMRIGDVRMKQQRYDDARTHYSRALELGTIAAKQKIAKLDDVSPRPDTPAAAPASSEAGGGGGGEGGGENEGEDGGEAPEDAEATPSDPSATASAPAKTAPL